jgi:hypothetical protein
VGIDDAECTGPYRGQLVATLSGQLDIQIPDGERTPDAAIVSCWLCPGGTCDDSSPYGPATAKIWWDREFESRVTEPWEVRFYLSPEDWLAGGTPPEPVSQYFCRIELASERPTYSGEYQGPPTLPDYFSAFEHARAEQGTPLVSVLQGALPTRIGEARD